VTGVLVWSLDGFLHQKLPDLNHSSNSAAVGPWEGVRAAPGADHDHRQWSDESLAKSAGGMRGHAASEPRHGPDGIAPLPFLVVSEIVRSAGSCAHHCGR
jgi:hypothetical protein